MKATNKENAKLAVTIELADIEHDTKFFETIEDAQAFASDFNIKAEARKCYNTTRCSGTWTIFIREYELDEDGYDIYSEDVLYFASATCDADGISFEEESL